MDTMTFVDRRTVNVVASKTIEAVNTTTNIDENGMNTTTMHFVGGNAANAAIANSIALRYIGIPLAKAETKVVPAAHKAINKTLTAAGNIAVRLGVACLKAGARAHNVELAKNGLEGAKVRKEGSVEASQG
jgi:hypothetical protein